MSDEETNEFEESGKQHCIMNSIESLRDHVLIMFGATVAKITADPTAGVELSHQKKFLEVWEVESIIAELCDVKDDGVYAIGADTFEEYKEKMLVLFQALATRIMSNVIQEGVRRELIDAEYDFEAGKFDFALTEKGKKLAVFGDGPPPSV